MNSFERKRIISVIASNFTILDAKKNPFNISIAFEQVHKLSNIDNIESVSIKRSVSENILLLLWYATVPSWYLVYLTLNILCNILIFGMDPISDPNGSIPFEYHQIFPD